MGVGYAAWLLCAAVERWPGENAQLKAMLRRWRQSKAARRGMWRGQRALTRGDSGVRARCGVRVDQESRLRCRLRSLNGINALSIFVAVVIFESPSRRSSKRIGTSRMVCPSLVAR